MNPADVQRFPSSVRLPSHTEPPFKARTWADAQFGIIVGVAGNVGVNILFTQFSGPSSGNFGVPAGNAPQAVSAGQRAEITWIRVSAVDLAIVSSSDPNIIRCSIRKGKGPSGTLPVQETGGVQGWINFAIDTATVLINSAFSSQLWLMGDTQHMEAPIHLEDNETAWLAMTFAGGGAATTWAIRASWGGWIYPVELEGEAGTIRGTAQDPGVRDPLGNRFRSR